MVFVRLNNLPYIQELTSRKSTLIQLEIICQYISYGMLLNSDPRLTAEVGAEHIRNLRCLFGCEYLMGMGIDQPDNPVMVRSIRIAQPTALYHFPLGQ